MHPFRNIRRVQIKGSAETLREHETRRKKAYSRDAATHFSVELERGAAAVIRRGRSPKTWVDVRDTSCLFRRLVNPFLSPATRRWRKRLDSEWVSCIQQRGSAWKFTNIREFNLRVATCTTCFSRFPTRYFRGDDTFVHFSLSRRVVKIDARYPALSRDEKVHRWRTINYLAFASESFVVILFVIIVSMTC